MTKQDPQPPLRSLSSAVLSTLALAWAEHSCPLSAAEAHAYLHTSGAGCSSLETTQHALSELTDKKIVYAAHGRYSLDGSFGAHEESRKRLRTSAKKMREIRAALFLLHMVPFVRAAAITGSVAFGNASEKSDIDIFCVAGKGRIWTARMGTLLLSELLGMRRERSHLRGKNKLCFNYFVAPDAEIPVQNIASATMLIRGIPVLGEPEFRRFLAVQTWMGTFLCRFYDDAQKTKSAHIPRTSSVLTGIRRGIEKILGNKLIGGAVESACKAWQLSRLTRKISQGGDASHFVVNDNVIALHHPSPKNKAVMERYAQKMKEYAKKLDVS